MVTTEEQAVTITQLVTEVQEHTVTFRGGYCNDDDDCADRVGCAAKWEDDQGVSWCKNYRCHCGWC